MAASPDLSRPQLLMLESLSAYRHEFVSGPDMRLNPVAYCHFIVPLAGQTYHVVSRIADAGLDYSRRTNMIAHHLVVSPEEMTQTDPGALIAAADSFVEKWDQAPMSLPFRAISAQPLVPGLCQHWADIAGDAGWGGILAAAGPNRPVVLIYSPGQDIFPLINESLALMPRQDRWKIGFSTFYQKLPPGVVCQWKGVLARSPEAASVCALPNALILDFTKPFPPVRSTSETQEYYIDAARTGVIKETNPEAKRPAVKKVPMARREVAVPFSNAESEPLPLYTQDSARENATSLDREASNVPVASGADAETMDRLAQLNSIYADMAQPRKSNRQFVLRLI
ncbi:MAG: hypothetical protein Q4G59_10960, partial [Planctomycetia bacterium]|nr:hypothetical protein [Planctomycetia bacterium]